MIFSNLESWYVFSFGCLYCAPAYHLSFGAEIGTRLDAPEGKSQNSYMLWSDYARTKEVIMDLWGKMKNLSRASQENSNNDLYTRLVLGGAGVLVMIACFVMKITKLKDLISSVGSYGSWNNQPAPMVLSNLGGARIWESLKESDKAKWILNE